MRRIKMKTTISFYNELEKTGFSLSSILPFLSKQKRGEGTLSKEKQVQMAAMTGKVNAPTFAYQAVYGKDPDNFLVGRTDAPKKMWEGLSVDKGIKDEWLNKLDSLPVEIRSTDEGKSWDRPAFVVIRMPEGKDNLYKSMSENLNKDPSLYVKADVGMGGRPRICIAGKIKKDGKGWNKWWETLPGKIENSYSRTVNK